MFASTSEACGRSILRVHHGRLIGAARSNMRILSSRDIDRKAIFFRANTSIYSIYLSVMKTTLVQWEIPHEVVQLSGFTARRTAQSLSSELAHSRRADNRRFDCRWISFSLMSGFLQLSRSSLGVLPYFHQKTLPMHLSICRLRGQSSGGVAGHEPRTGGDLSKHAVGADFRAIPVRAKTYRQRR